MKLGTLRTGDSTVAVRVDATTAIEIEGVTDVGALLDQPEWREVAANANGATHALAAIEPTRWAAVVPRPSKIVCVGLNYRTHILEMGRQLPDFPTLFAKYPEALIGPYDAIELPSNAATAVDWEGELAVIIGKAARRVSEDGADDYIAGYSVLNDVTMRDFQYRTTEWFQGKTFENSSPFGPHLVTGDEYSPESLLQTVLDGEVMQSAVTSDLVFSPRALVAYISGIVTLRPGDVISTGTPGGVGHARKPPRYLSAGATLTTSIDGIGSLVNPIVAER